MTNQSGERSADGDTMPAQDPNPGQGIPGGRAALYLRVSTGRQAEQELSIPDQRRQTTDWCNRQGLAIAAEFVEAGASATDDRRPEFQRMVEYVCDRQNQVAAVIVHSFSRFMRDSFAFEFYVRRLAKSGVRVLSVTQDVREDDPAQLMMRKVIALFDEYQSLENAKHVLRAMKENARQGFWNGARPPFGFRIIEAERRGDRVKKRIDIDLDEAETVRLIFRLFLDGDGTSGTLGVKAIAVWLNERGYRTRKGSRWGVATIHKLLTNSAYAGQYRFNRVEARTGRTKPAVEQVVTEVPPIIELTVFDQVQAALKARNPRVTPPRVVSGPILLTGLAVCGSCGGAMTLRTGTSKSGTIHRYYACSTKGRQGPTGCKGRSIRVDRLDEAVTRHVIQRILEPERMAGLLGTLPLRRKEQEQVADRRIAEIEGKLREAEQSLQRLYSMIEKGQTTPDELLLDRVERLKAERSSCQAALERATTGRESVTPIDEAKLKAFAELMRTRLTDGEVQFRKAYLSALIERVEVGDSEVRIFGQKTVLEQQVATGGGDRPGVRSFVRRWRSLGESNPCFSLERAAS